MPATTLNGFTCCHVRVVGPTGVVGTGRIPDPTLRFKPCRSDVVGLGDSGAWSALSKGDGSFGGHDDTMRHRARERVLADPGHEFSDVFDQLAAGKRPQRRPLSSDYERGLRRGLREMPWPTRWCGEGFDPDRLPGSSPGTRIRGVDRGFSMPGPTFPNRFQARR